MADHSDITPARQPGMLFGHAEPADEDARSEISSLRPLSPPHTGMQTTVHARDESVPAVPTLDTKGHKDLKIDSIVMDTYKQLNIRDQATAKFNNAIDEMLRETYDVSLHDLTETDAGQSTDHLANLARVAMESSAAICTEIFEIDFFQVLQERIDIAHAEELSKHVFNVPGLPKVPKRADHFILLALLLP